MYVYCVSIYTYIHIYIYMCVCVSPYHPSRPGTGFSAWSQLPAIAERPIQPICSLDVPQQVRGEIWGDQNDMGNL